MRSHLKGRNLIVLASLLILPIAGTVAVAQQPQGWAQAPSYNGQYAPVQQPSYGPAGYAQPDAYGSQPYQQPAYPAGGQQTPPPASDGHAQPLTAAQLEQLVAPIALYPDTLVAQVLAASTYPAQVVQADRWRQSQDYVSADQVAAGANAQIWDPSVKALTAFPQVLQQMDQNLQWTTDLGNAYFNQPQDVLEAVQILRQRAQTAGTLQNTPQEQMSYDQGSIELAPPTPQVVYVPTYNPWTVYGQPLNPYPGFSLLNTIGSFLGALPLRYGPGILMSAFSASPSGWLGWALNWLNLSVLFNHSNYYTHSTTVADWGLPHGGWRAAAERGGMVATSYRPSGNYGGSYGRPANGYTTRPSGQNFASAPNRYPASGAYNPARAYPTPQNNTARPAQLAYNHPQSPYGALPYTGSQYGRPTGPNSYGYPGANYANRTTTAYGAGMSQPYRAPAGYQPGSFGNRSSGGFTGNGFTGSPAKLPSAGGFHPFGGGHPSGNSFGGGHAPKGFGGGGFGGGKISAPKHFGGGGGGHFGGGKHRL
jgi:hypothetical protein